MKQETIAYKVLLKVIASDGSESTMRFSKFLTELFHERGPR